jgi:hypothetical protein
MRFVMRITTPAAACLVSDTLALAPKAPWLSPPARDELLARVKELALDALPGHVRQSLRLELSCEGAIEPFVGSASVRTLLRDEAKEALGAVIIEAVAVAMFERDAIPVVLLRRHGEEASPVHRVAVVDDVGRVARKASEPMLVGLAMRRFECRAECRLREPVRIGKCLASDYFQTYLLSALSRRDVEHVVGDDVARDGAVLTALHDVREMTIDGDPDQQRGPVEKEARLFFGA